MKNYSWQLLKKVRRLLASNLALENKKKLIAILEKNYLARQLLNWSSSKPVDTYIISFPKCGRSWLRLMIGKAIQVHFNVNHPDILPKIYMLDELASFHNEIPKIVVTHDDNSWQKRPDELINCKEKYKHAKVILLVRDPRDVVVSSYFHKKKREKCYDGDLSTYIHEQIGSFDTIISFYNIWAINRYIPKKFMLLRYEDLHTDPHKHLRRVLNFLDLQSISDEVIAEAVRFGSFENMRNLEKEDAIKHWDMRPADRDDPDSYKTRQGKVGSFVEYLNQDEIEYLNGRMKETLSDFYEYL